MYELVRTTPMPRLIAMQGPVVAASLVIAEVFYKFHSFTLECAAFLATWFAIDATVSFARRALGPRSNTPSRAAVARESRL